MGRARTSRRPLYFLTTILFSALLAVPVHGAEKTTLTVYFQWGNVIDTLNRAVEIFEAENPDIDVITVPACIDCGSGYEQLPWPSREEPRRIWSRFPARITWKWSKRA